MTHPTPLLTIDNLVIRSDGDGEKSIVDGISLQLRPGEVLGLIGESGAGKSTLGLAAMGFVRQGLTISGGSVRFNGTDLVDAYDASRRKVRGQQISYVAQSAAASFNPAHKLINQCIETRVVEQHASVEESRRKVEGLFTQLQLPQPMSIGQRYPHQLSGGQLQRVMTAMALTPDPRIVVFDEPTTALDVTTQVEVLVSIRRAVRENGLAALYISHDLAVVAQIADSILVLRHGKAIEYGTVEQILYSPQEAYTKLLVGTRKNDVRPPRATTKEVLGVSGIFASYGNHPVLKDIDLSAERGETVAIVGESGSGKSTLGRVIAGLMAPAAGNVMLDGKPLAPTISERKPAELRQLQLIHQNPDMALNPQHSVRRIIGRPLTFFEGLRGTALNARINQLIELIELDPAKIIDRKPSELSGGQKQRICIARALAATPSVLILDEATSALDPLVAQGILKLLARLQRETDTAYLFITHDLDTVQSIADRVVVMQQGSFVESGQTARIFTGPQEPYTQRLLNSTPEMDVHWLDRVLAQSAP